MKEADSEESSRRRLVVAGAPEESRMDVFLAAQLPDLSRSRITQLLATGRILVNGAPARKSAKPSEGDVIEISVPPAEPSHIAPENIPLSIVFEDADLAVIDKPAGLVVHPAPGHRTGTLVNALLHHVTDLSGIGGVKRPGIVHRLDRDTSGLLLVAKNDDAHRALSEALRRREIGRTYLALAWGHLTDEEIRIDAPIARAHNDRKRMAVIETGRPAATRIRRLERFRSADLVTAELETGRTHQIRVHLASIGHPVVGDMTYGAGGSRGFSGPARKWAQDLERRVPRQFLHATMLRLTHPRTGEALVFESPLPEDLAAASEWARRSAGG